MTMRQRGWIPSADRAHKPVDVALLDTMQIVVDTPLVTRFPHATGAVSACPGSFTSDVVSLEVTT